MTTIEVVKYRDVLRVSAIPGFVQGVSVPTIELKGEDFRYAEQVQINDVEVPEFVVVNRQTIYAQMPSNVRQIRTVAVLSSRFTSTTQASRVAFRIGDKTRTVSGLFKLVQLYVKVLLQSPGSDIFEPEFGGGLQELVGQLVSTNSADRVLSGVTQAIQQTTSQIRKAQSNTPSIPLNERLLSATLLDVRTVKSLDEARARVLIENVAGETGVSSVEL